MQPQAKASRDAGNHQRPEEAGRTLPGACRGRGGGGGGAVCRTWISDFRPPEPREDAFLRLQAPESVVLCDGGPSERLQGILSQPLL